MWPRALALTDLVLILWCFIGTIAGGLVGLSQDKTIVLQSPYTVLTKKIGDTTFRANANAWGICTSYDGPSDAKGECKSYQAFFNCGSYTKDECQCRTIKDKMAGFAAMAFLAALAKVPLAVLRVCGPKLESNAFFAWQHLVNPGNIFFSLAGLVGTAAIGGIYLHECNNKLISGDFKKNNDLSWTLGAGQGLLWATFSAFVLSSAVSVALVFAKMEMPEKEVMQKKQGKDKVRAARAKEICRHETLSLLTPRCAPRPLSALPSAQDGFPHTFE